jgi:hypothetical protein
MHFLSRITPIICAAVLAFDATPSFAVDAVLPLSKFSIVGVIAGGKSGTDVAVIRDNSTKKSLTVSVGSRLGTGGNYVVTKIATRTVELTLDGKRYALDYVLPDKIEASTPEANVSAIATPFEGRLSSFFTGIQGYDDSALADQWSRDDAGEEPTTLVGASDLYPTLLQKKRNYQVEPLVEAEGQANGAEYRNFNSTDGLPDEFEEERKFRERFRSRHLPLVKEVGNAEENPIQSANEETPTELDE